MEVYEKIKRRFALKNSYFKNRRPQDPSTPYEVVAYFEQWEELPYNEEPSGSWLYDCFCEYQKRAGVVNSQFFTPTATANLMVRLLLNYASPLDQVLDACCGFGQITKQLIKKDFQQVWAFDNDSKMVDLMSYLYINKVQVYKADYNNFTEQLQKFPFIISNPPYDGKELTAFLGWLHEQLYGDGIAVLLIPAGFLDKSRPDKLVKFLNKFGIMYRELMSEKFERTNTTAEIVVLKKL